jgi:hypothetical protein
MLPDSKASSRHSARACQVLVDRAQAEQVVEELVDLLEDAVVVAQACG